MILSAQTIRSLCTSPNLAIAGFKPMLAPFSERDKSHGMTYGLGPAGYDVRLAQNLRFGHDDRYFHLGSTVEEFHMPTDVLGVVHDKSTWARRGLAVQNTVIEPGWSGFLTLELTLHAQGPLHIEAGTPIAQIIFHRLDHPTDAPYDGKYQNQQAGPQPARMEK